MCKKFTRLIHSQKLFGVHVRRFTTIRIWIKRTTHETDIEYAKSFLFFFFFFFQISRLENQRCFDLDRTVSFQAFYIFARFANTYCCTHVEDSFFFFIHVLYNRACSNMCSVARFIYQKWKTEEAFLERDINNFNINSRLRVKFICVIYILFLDFWKVVHLVSVNFLHKKYSISHLKI